MPELRKDPIIWRWVIISTARGKRPSDFPSEPAQFISTKSCPFCSGNERMTPTEIEAFREPGTEPNTPGWQIRVVSNKFPALEKEGDLNREGIGLYDRMNGFGAHEVIIETPDHKQRMHEYEVAHLEKILAIYRHRITDLFRDKRLRYALIFKNEGKEAGASLEHSHTQLIATPVTPKQVQEELQGGMKYFAYKERCIYCDILAQESKTQERLVYENAAYLAFCPFASIFPFETWLVPKQHNCDFHIIEDDEIPYLADVLKTTLAKLVKVLNNPQYNFMLHTSPNRFRRRGYWTTIEDDYHWHIEIVPRLTKVAGFEWGTGFYINPTSPEDAAAFLREAQV